MHIVNVAVMKWLNLLHKKFKV